MARSASPTGTHMLTVEIIQVAMQFKGERWVTLRGDGSLYHLAPFSDGWFCYNADEVTPTLQVGAIRLTNQELSQFLSQHPDLELTA